MTAGAPATEEDTAAARTAGAPATEEDAAAARAAGAPVPCLELDQRFAMKLEEANLGNLGRAPLLTPANRGLETENLGRGSAGAGARRRTGDAMDPKRGR